MDKEDIRMLQIISSQQKMRYDELDVSIKKNISGTMCYVLIDITFMLEGFKEFYDSLVDRKDFILHAAIEVLNVYSHYKHFFKSRDSLHTVVIGYCKDKWTYDHHNRIMDAVVNFCRFFPNVYTIPNITKGALNTHVVAACINYINFVTNLKGAKSSIYVFSNFQHDKQLMCTFPTYKAYYIHKGMHYQNSTFLSKEDYIHKIAKNPEYYDNFKRKGEFEMLNIAIGRYFNSFILKSSKGERIPIKFAHFKLKDKINIVSDFINSGYSIKEKLSISNQFILYLQSIGELSGEDNIEAFIRYEKKFDYRYQATGFLNRIIAPLFESWNKKIKDHEVAKESEEYKTLIDHELNLSWLI